MNYVELSKEISYVLRHNPQQYGLELDEQGWVNVDVLIASLREQGRFKSLSINDLEKMIQVSEKKRHEIYDGKIRALYGHLVKEKIVKEPTKPPDVLYHGTARRFTQSIFDVGLVSKNRQYVHLLEDINTAETVGKRRDEKPTVLKINAKQAWDDGVLFYWGSDNIWLADDIPAKHISLPYKS